MCALEDELIREVTINCAERGLLLLRVRDEIRMTIAAYQTLYESSVAFGMRKALQAEQGKSDMERKVSGVYRKPWPSVTLTSVSGPRGCHSSTKFLPPRVLSRYGPLVQSVRASLVMAEFSPLGYAMPVTDSPLGGSTDPGNILGWPAIFQVPSTQALKPAHPLGNTPG